jgi:hypothetical protein
VGLPGHYEAITAHHDQVVHDDAQTVSQRRTRLQLGDNRREPSAVGAHPPAV